MSISVLTIVRGRQRHLENQRTGLLKSSIAPAEWIVVGMDQEVELKKSDAFSIRTSRVDGDGQQLPLAEARNHAASLCNSDRMIFLDVDCIPSKDMIANFDAAVSAESKLWMGSPQYLPAGSTEGNWQFGDLSVLASQHPLQPELRLSERQSSTRYEMFWSLCFAITKKNFDAIGGFDDSFDGYGGEDTDFAFAARKAGIPFGFVGATAFHQHHAVCKPPLNHFQAIVRNAKRFREKWGVWPMESWLSSFAALDLVSFDAELDQLEVVREPTAEEIEEAKSLAPAGF